MSHRDFQKTYPERFEKRVNDARTHRNPREERKIQQRTARVSEESSIAEEISGLSLKDQIQEYIDRARDEISSYPNLKALNRLLRIQSTENIECALNAGLIELLNSQISREVEDHIAGICCLIISEIVWYEPCLQQIYVSQMIKKIKSVLKTDRKECLKYGYYALSKLILTDTSVKAKFTKPAFLEMTEIYLQKNARERDLEITRTIASFTVVLCKTFLDLNSHDLIVRILEDIFYVEDLKTNAYGLDALRNLLNFGTNYERIKESGLLKNVVQHLYSNTIEILALMVLQKVVSYDPDFLNGLSLTEIAEPMMLCLKNPNTEVKRQALHLFELIVRCNPTLEEDLLNHDTLEICFDCLADESYFVQLNASYLIKSLKTDLLLTMSPDVLSFTLSKALSNDDREILMNLLEVIKGLVLEQDEIVSSLRETEFMLKLQILASHRNSIISTFTKDLLKIIQFDG